MSNTLRGVVQNTGFLQGSVYGGGRTASAPKITTVTLLSSKWIEIGSNLYSQSITISGVTPNSKIDLNPSVTQLAVFHEKDLAFVVENDDGVITVWCIGQKPTGDYTMQATITEVIING